MKDLNVSRREFLRTTSAAAGAVIASSMLPQASAQEANRKRPNIVFFYTEGQRADALSLAGNPILRTPNQDRIGREGVYCNNSFCTNALCAPARAVTLTGLHSHTSGALDNQTTEALPPDVPIFTDLLHQAGYDVAMVGKAHVGNGARERYWTTTLHSMLPRQISTIRAFSRAEMASWARKKFTKASSEMSSPTTTPWTGPEFTPMTSSRIEHWIG